MQLVQLCHGADHVARLGPFFHASRHSQLTPNPYLPIPNPFFLQPPALPNKSFRGSSGSIRSSSFIRFRTRSSVRFGTITCTSTYWSPRVPFRALGTPFSRK